MKRLILICAAVLAVAAASVSCKQNKGPVITAIIDPTGLAISAIDVYYGVTLKASSLTPETYVVPGRDVLVPIMGEPGHVVVMLAPTEEENAAIKEYREASLAKLKSKTDSLEKDKEEMRQPEDIRKDMSLKVPDLSIQQVKTIKTTEGTVFSPWKEPIKVNAVKRLNRGKKNPGPANK